MGLISLDTNILVYAVDPSAGERHDISLDILRRAAVGDALLTQQVICDFLNVSRKSAHLDQARLRRIAAGLCAVYPIAPTKPDAVFEAFDLAQRHQLQFWDALIVSVCRQNEVTTLLTEDMQDGRQFGSVRILNPFLPENAATITELLRA